MKKFNNTILFSAPLLIYALGLLGSKQALIGVIVYSVWLYLGIDEEDNKIKQKRHDRLQA